MLFSLVFSCRAYVCVRKYVWLVVGSWYPKGRGVFKKSQKNIKKNTVILWLTFVVGVFLSVHSIHLFDANKQSPWCISHSQSVWHLQCSLIIYILHLFSFYIYIFQLGHAFPLHTILLFSFFFIFLSSFFRSFCEFHTILVFSHSSLILLFVDDVHVSRTRKKK